VRTPATLALNMMTAFSIPPAQMADVTGFTLALVGVGVLIYVVGWYPLHGTSGQGFPFLSSAIAIFSGAQWFALSVLGEYPARVHFRIDQRPTYTVREGSPQ